MRLDATDKTHLVFLGMAFVLGLAWGFLINVISVDGHLWRNVVICSTAIWLAWRRA